MKSKTSLSEFISNTNHHTPTYEKKLKFIYSQIIQYSKKHDKEIHDLKILEAGCGDGGISIPLASLGCKVKSFDIDQNYIKHVQNIIKENNITNLEVTEGNAYTSNDNQTYDIIILSEVLEHVLEPEKLLANLIKMTHNTSCLIVTCPNGYGPWEIKNRLFIYPFVRNNHIRRLMHRPDYVFGAGGDHCQFYKKLDIVDFLSDDFDLVSFSNSDSIFASLDLIYNQSRILTNFFSKIDSKLADHVPYWLGSGWFFCFEKI